MDRRKTRDDADEVDGIDEHLRAMAQALGGVDGPFPPPCNQVLGLGYPPPYACGWTGDACEVPCDRVATVCASMIEFPTIVDFGVKRSAKALILSRAKDIDARIHDPEGSLEFVVLADEMREFGVSTYPVLAFTDEYRGKSTHVVRIW